MPEELLEAVRAEAGEQGARDERSQLIADLIRTATERRWVGVYEVTATEVVNLAWSGPAPPAYPRFPLERGLTAVAISTRQTVVSNDVARDPRYLTALDSTGSELIVPATRRRWRPHPGRLNRRLTAELVVDLNKIDHARTRSHP